VGKKKKSERRILGEGTLEKKGGRKIFDRESRVKRRGALIYIFRTGGVSI